MAVADLRYVKCTKCGEPILLVYDAASNQFMGCCEICGIYSDLQSIPFAGLRDVFKVS